MKLNSARAKSIINALEQGNTRKVAAESSGISARTLQRWLKMGRDNEGRQFVKLLASVEKAEATAAAAMVKSLVAAADKGEWRAAAWWLERRYPNDWGRRPRPVVTDEEQGPVSFVVQIGGGGGKPPILTTNAPNDELCT